jgi:hypothetical protein
MLHESLVQALPSSTATGVLSEHAPAPLHLSFVVQALLSLHGVLVGETVQVPLVPSRLQDWQTPLQGVLQQAPCMQKPLAQSAFDVHENAS